MKIKIYLLLTILFVMGCKNNQSTPKAETNEEEFQEFDETMNQDGMIAIETTFEPTLELTDEIKNTTLEDLIKQGKGHLSKSDQAKQDAYLKERRKKMESEDISNKQTKESDLANIVPSRQYVSSTDIIREYKLKYVPATSNLAKVYYLEDMGRFIEHNENFYNEIISKIQEESEQSQEQKNWDKYLR